MSDWVCTIAERWCLPILQKMHELLLAGNVIHADETVLQVLHEAGRKATTDSRMWVYCNAERQVRLQYICHSKSSEILQQDLPRRTPFGRSDRN